MLFFCRVTLLPLMTDFQYNFGERLALYIRVGKLIYWSTLYESRSPFFYERSLPKPNMFIWWVVGSSERIKSIEQHGKGKYAREKSRGFDNNKRPSSSQVLLCEKTHPADFPHWRRLLNCPAYSDPQSQIAGISWDEHNSRLEDYHQEWGCREGSPSLP